MLRLSPGPARCGKKTAYYAPLKCNEAKLITLCKIVSNSWSGKCSKLRLGDMRLLGSAQPFGFGPVAKLVTVAAHLDRMKITFAGQGIALTYAQLNDRYFTEVRHFDLANIVETRQLLRQFDAAISVMEPQLVYASVREKLPVYFFDSLFDFWIVGRPYEELASIARLILTGIDRSAESAFMSLSVPESMVVSHMMATRAYAQGFPGVAERIDLLDSLGFGHVQATGSMIDLREIGQLDRSSVPMSRTLVANLGGFTNAFLDYERHGAYIDITLRWLTRLSTKTRDFDEIVVCSGAFAEPYTQQVNGVNIRAGLLPHPSLLEILAGAPVYLTPPGLTSLHEAVALSIVPMWLPDQHYGHTCNRRRLAHTSFAARGASFGAMGLKVDLPNDDLRATLALSEIARQIRDDPVLFDTYATYMDGQLAGFIRTSLEETSAQLRELEELLDGVPIDKFIASLEQEVTLAAARVTP